MRERRISFTKENRDKSRAGVKTQTRRLVNPQPTGWTPEQGSDPAMWYWCVAGDQDYSESRKCPYGAPGGRLYLLEPYQIGGIGVSKVNGIYLDDNSRFCIEPTDAEWKRLLARKNPYIPTQARFMYRSLARTWFDVVEVRAERIQDISDWDLLEEGMTDYGYMDGRDEERSRRDFIALWDLINGKRSPWVQNDFVWAITYKLAEVDTCKR